ncbi:GATA transcription factor 26 isoform X2 [Silene latifolia]|uniref:GATA transcription factor 26 isoform X2 n=1 Tax=Silene latifolia TaxID=37657 RepID=UPI003D78B2BB
MGKQGPCYHCGVASTPLWRNGPPEKPVLCNACGSRWRTKGTLVNYTPLHSRLDPEDYEDHRIGRMKSISLKKKEEKLNKRKLNYENTMTMDREFTPDYSQGHQKNIDEDMSNRSSFGSAVSNSESCAQFGSADASELTGPSQSVVWDSMIPSRKRTCVTRPKQSSVEKLTKDLYTIYHEQASQFSGSSEEDLLYESDAPMVSVEIGHGSVLIRHPSTMVKEEESEASSLSVDNKLCRAYERYSNAASLMSHNDSKSVNNSFSPVEEVKRLNGQVTQLGQLKRDKYNNEKIQILCNHKSPLSYIDLTEIVNFEVFQGYLTDEEQQCLLKYLPSVDTSAGFDSFENIFASTHIKENLSCFQQLLADGVLDSSFSGVKTEDCKVLKRLALCNSSKFKWVEQYNMLKKQTEDGREEQISKSGAKTCSAGTLWSGNRFRGKHNHIGAEAKCTMKSPERTILKVDYKKKAPLQDEMPYFIPTPKNVFAFPGGGGGGHLMLDSMHCEDEASDQDLLLEVPSNGSFPQAELLCPASSYVSQQASASSSSTYPFNIRA